MKLKTLMVATVLAAAPTFVLAEGCFYGTKEQSVASCPAGQTWDAGTEACVDQATS
ncbi:MAG: hypothetical protein AAFX00_01890 [Pseudomonadota bacterium]